MSSNDPAINQIREGLKSAASAAKNTFESSSILVMRDDFSRSRIGDNGTGAVYVYYNAHGEAVYVGQTGRYVKARLYDQTSPHQKKEWWNDWSTMRFLPMQNGADRLVLEFLLILAYSPPINLKPGSIKVEDLFAHLQTTHKS